jgi:hypothetical protein
MSEVERITIEKAREKVLLGRALLVCAYDRDDKFAQYHLEGAISLSAFKKKVSGLPKEQEIIFYCN